MLLLLLVTMWFARGHGCACGCSLMLWLLVSSESRRFSMFGAEGGSSSGREIGLKEGGWFGWETCIARTW